MLSEEGLPHAREEGLRTVRKSAAETMNINRILIKNVTKAQRSKHQLTPQTGGFNLKKPVDGRRRRKEGELAESSDVKAPVAVPIALQMTT